jgi:hypothetical protein
LVGWGVIDAREGSLRRKGLRREDEGERWIVVVDLERGI